MAIPFAGWTVACASALLFSGVASAATRTSAFRVMATVVASCRIDVPAPSALPLRDAVAMPAVHVHCSSRTPYALTVRSTLHDAGADPARRLVVLVTY